MHTKEERYDVKYLERALIKAAETNNVDAVQLLLDHVKPSKFWVLDELTDALQVAFSAAAEAGRDEFIRFAVAKKLHDRSVPSAALYWAAEHGHNEWIKLLLDNGADVNSTVGTFGRTALRVAAMQGQVDCLTTLIEHGADVEARAFDWSPLHLATNNGHTECVTALLRHGADINSRSWRPNTPKHTQHNVLVTLHEMTCTARGL